VSDETKKQLPVPSQGKATASPDPRRIWPLWILVILLLLATGVMGFLMWQQWQEGDHYQERVQDRLTSLEDSTSSLRDEQRSLRESREERLNRLESKLDNQTEQLSAQTRQIEHNARALLGLGQRTRTDWLLAEAEYLMRLANQRLFFEGDFRSAMAMLESADEVLNETDDVGVYPVRQALAREILSLRSIEPVDRAGLYLRLDAAIEELDRVTEGALQGRAENGTDLLDDEPASDGPWARILDSLREVVVIRRMDMPVQPMMSPEQSTQARLHLRLMLEEAGIAVLRRDQAVYDRSLRRADEWLNTWYDQSDARVQALQETLNELSGKQIDPALPDISESLTLLKSRIAGRLDKNTEENDDAPTTEDETGESDS